MNLYILQIDPNLLSVTGVIATVLAVIFGLGAFSNSRSRKRHMIQLEKAQRQEQALHFRPAKSHLPMRSTLPGRSAAPATGTAASKSTNPHASTPRPAPVAKVSTPPEKTTETKASEKPVLFRKVRPDGLDQPQKAGVDEDQELYVWE
jgi:hypothetical protein